MINKRISYISFDKERFDKAATDYNKAFKNSCFNENIYLYITNSSKKKKQQKHFMV